MWNPWMQMATCRGLGTGQVHEDVTAVAMARGGVSACTQRMGGGAKQWQAQCGDVGRKCTCCAQSTPALHPQAPTSAQSTPEANNHA